MNIPFEKISPDNNSSFRVLHHKVFADAFTWDYHYHPEVELVFVIKGTGRRHVGQHISYYENGDLVLIGSNLPHAGFGYGSQNEHEEIVIQFKSEIFNNSIEFTKIHDLIEKAKVGLVFGAEIKAEVEESFYEIVKLTNIERYQSLMKILNLLAFTESYDELNTVNLPSTSLFKDQKRVAAIFDYVETKYNLNISSKDIAKVVNMTQPAFCNYYKATFNTTFTDFLNVFRIKKSIEFLNTGDNISEAAFKTGFESLAYFSRLFKKIKGVSPSMYLRNSRKL